MVRRSNRSHTPRRRRSSSGFIPLVIRALARAQLSCGSADAPELKHIDLPGGLVDVKAAKNQISAITMVDFAAHQIREKQPPPLKLGEWQAEITLPAICAVIYDRNVAPFVLSRPSVRDETL
jgi:hypothetical protein